MDRLYNTQREKVQQISVEHTMKVLGGRIGLVFYDVTTLYFESMPQPDDELRHNGETFSLILSINKMLKQSRLDDLHDALSGFFASIPYNANYQERAWSYESHYHYTLYLIFRLLSCYTTLTEKKNSRGRADIIVETADYIYIFEFKLDGTADEALKQIDDKGYAEPYAADSRKLFRIGVGFSSEKRNIAEWKVV